MEPRLIDAEIEEPAAERAALFTPSMEPRLIDAEIVILRRA